MFYIFYGDDQFSLSEKLAELRGELAAGDPVMGDLNTTILDGRRISLGELRHAADSIPFMADRRLIVVYDLLTRLVPRAKAAGQQEVKFTQDLVAYLPNLPASTRLIFCEEGNLSDSHPILAIAREEGKRHHAHVRHFKLPKESELPGWIRARAAEKGGKISNEALGELVTLVGSDLRTLDQEIEKLLLYTGGRQVTSDDVKLLVHRSREADVFALVDHVGARQTNRALVLLHQMLEDEKEPLYLLAMLARQIRILIQVKELADRGMTGREQAAELHLHPFVAEKGLRQARNFEMDQLEKAHDKLVEADWAIKTGRADALLALDTLIVGLTRL